jgi:iron-sulfur cluster assembly protein
MPKGFVGGACFERARLPPRPFRRASGREAIMANMVSIGTQSAEEAFAVQPRASSTTPQAATAQGLQVTEKAIKRIRVAMAKEGVSPVEGGLRLGVMGGGCSGLSYSIKFDTQPRERDRIYEFDGVRVFVDPKSFLYLHGMTLDYEETLMRQGFNFINPNSARSCGCGSSFSS